MKKTGLIMLLFLSVLLWAGCNKSRSLRVLINPPPPPPVYVQSIIFTTQILHTGNTRFNFPTLTKSIIDSGTVVAFFKRSDSTQWIGLPYRDSVIQCQMVEPLSVGTMIMFSASELVDYDFRFDLTPGH